MGIQLSQVVGEEFQQGARALLNAEAELVEFLVCLRGEAIKLFAAGPQVRRRARGAKHRKRFLQPIGVAIRG